MQVKANTNVDAAANALINRSRNRPVAAETDTASFQRVANLDQALQATPVARPEAVSKARELIGDVKYPPSVAIEGIAALLALRLESSSGAESNS